MPLATSRPGRPPKFGRPARAVTVTLPEDVLARLAAIDRDIGRAVVRLAEEQATPTAALPAPAEISRYGRHAVILVTPLRALKRLPGVELVPIGNGRALIALQAPHSVSSLELSIRDVLDGQPVPAEERRALETVAEILREARSSRGIRAEERTIVVLETTRRPTAK